MQPTSESYTQPPIPSPPARREPRARWPWLTAGAVLLVAAAVVGTLLVQRALDGGGTFTVRGSVDITGVYSAGSPGQPCDMSRRPGAADLAEGGQVVVYDASGRTLAIGTLGEGALTAGGVCRMPFAVGGVPDGPGPFAVEVTHRGRIAFTRAQAGAVEMSLPLG